MKKVTWTPNSTSIDYENKLSNKHDIYKKYDNNASSHKEENILGKFNTLK